MRFSEFSDGLWLPEGRDFGVPSNALLKADNIEYLLSGAVIGRRGSEKLNSVALGGPIRSNWRHYPRSATPSTLVAVDEGGMVHFYDASGTSGTFAAVSGGVDYTSGVPWYFTNWPAKNKTFMTNGFDAMQSYSGTAIATVTSAGGVGNLSPVPKGPYLCLHKSRLWVTKPDELNYSVYASAVNDETTFPAANQLSVNDPKGGKITGLASFFDFLIILKSTSLWRFIGDISTLTGAQLARYSDIGCTAPNATAITPYGVIFVGKSGVYLTDGVSPNPTELSAPVRSLWNQRGSQETFSNAVGGWYSTRGKQQYWLKLDPQTTDGYVITRLEVLSANPFIGERSRAVWLWSHVTDMPVANGTSVATWPADDDDGRITIGDSYGFVRTFDIGSTDDGDAIASVIQTTSRPLDPKGRTGRVYDAELLHRASVPLTVGLRYDQHVTSDVTFSVGAASSVTERWPRVTITDFTKMGRFVSVVVSNPSDSYEFELHMIQLSARLRGARVWRDTNA